MNEISAETVTSSLPDILISPESLRALRQSSDQAEVFQPVRQTIHQALLDEVLMEYSHACPHCPATVKPVWVVDLDEIPEILRRVGVTVLD